jgi:hypothetical protein
MIGNKATPARQRLPAEGKVETLTKGVFPQRKLSGVSAF